MKCILKGVSWQSCNQNVARESYQTIGQVASVCLEVIRLSPVEKECAKRSCQTEVNPEWGAPYRYIWWQERSAHGRVHNNEKLIFRSGYQARAQKKPPNRAPVVAFIFVPYILRIAWEGRKVVPLQKKSDSHRFRI